MSKGLEAFEDLVSNYPKNYSESYQIVLKELKALEIIKEMRTYKDDIAIAETLTDVEESENFDAFSSRYRNFFSKEEYEILKEVLS